MISYHLPFSRLCFHFVSGFLCCAKAFKTIFDKPTPLMLKAFPLRSGTRQGCPILPLLLNIVLEVTAVTIREQKRNKINPNWKGKSKIVTICRKHGHPCGISDEMYKKSFKN